MCVYVYTHIYVCTHTHTHTIVNVGEISFLNVVCRILSLAVDRNSAYFGQTAKREDPRIRLGDCPAAGALPPRALQSCRRRLRTTPSSSSSVLPDIAQARSHPESVRSPGSRVRCADNRSPFLGHLGGEIFATRASRRHGRSVYSRERGRRRVREETFPR